ncbi:hypothetical protein JQK62_24275, partial [Leptospira santarosai]|nr:hypothetical protein [Leptospira santarosai]
LFESYLWANTMHIRAVHVFFISACSLLLFGIPGIFTKSFSAARSRSFQQTSLVYITIICPFFHFRPNPFIDDGLK